MNVNYYEICAFIISLVSLIYGLIYLSKKDMYNKLFIYASGCYLLEELWVIVNTLFGHIDSLLTLRLFGIFGCYMFLLTASIKQFENIKFKNIELKTLIIPALFLIAYFINYGLFVKSYLLLGLVILTPILIASHYNSKAIIFSKDNLELKRKRIINIWCILFYILNIIYFCPYIKSIKIILEISDIFVALAMFVLLVLNRRCIKS